MLLCIKKTNIPISHIAELKTFAEKSRGLIGTSSPYGVYFQTRWGIHTFGMQFPIGVLVTDKNFCVKKIKKSLPPNTFFFWNPFWGNVFELSEEALKKIEVQKGDILELRR